MIENILIMKIYFLIRFNTMVCNFKETSSVVYGTIRPMYRLRFLMIITKCLLSSSRDLLDNFSVSFMALPFIDTDFIRLFTHSYSSYMALCRWHFVFNSKLRDAALKKGWAPVTTSEVISYKKSIKAFDRVVVKTKLLHWNNKRFYLVQSFWVRGNLCAECYVEGLIRSPSGILEPPAVFKNLGVFQNSPKATPQLLAVFPFLQNIESPKKPIDKLN